MNLGQFLINSTYMWVDLYASINSTFLLYHVNNNMVPFVNYNLTLHPKKHLIFKPSPNIVNDRLNN